MSLKSQVKKLNRSDIDSISYHYDAAMETSHGSGDHWILMATLDQCGIRTYSPTKAMKIAEEVMTLWYQLQK
jgi:hypothetical protein